MNYWLIKSEPSVFSIEDMKAKNIESWDGVRNYQARNFMKEMKKDDLCFFYHSNTKLVGIVGLVEVVKEFYPDPLDERFVLVDVRYKKHIPFISLEDLKLIPQLQNLPLFKQSRLSIQPVDSDSAHIILKLNP
jgi:predicted RNA-binding protein with PUA-like domain